MHSGFQELLDEFLLEAKERADEVEAMLLRLTTVAAAEGRRESLAQAKRELHTLKGNAGMMGFTELQQLAHLMEDGVEELDLESPQVDSILTLLDALRQGLEAVRAPAVDQATTEESAEVVATNVEEKYLESDGARDVGGSVRVPFTKIDQLVELQAESLIFRNRLSDALSKGLSRAKSSRLTDTIDIDANFAAWEEVNDARQALDKTLHQLQDQVTSLGMVPLQSLFRSLGRIVHDESRREGKKVDFEVAGGDTPIDKTLLEAAGDALGHLVRNAVIHGIESPEQRSAAGKRETGKIRVQATLESAEVRIEVSDDGGGIATAKLRARARELNPHLADSVSDIALLFEGGISTREAADLAAGRGVGLSAVKRSVERHGGRVRVRSEPGQGTAFSLLLPVTASILRVLLLRADNEEYAIALSAVAEIISYQEATKHDVHQAGVISWRGLLVPLLDLGSAFGTTDKPRQSGFLVLLDVNDRRRGLLIDGLVGIRDIVVKALDKIVGQHLGVSGSTILGDGRVIMILDPSALVAQPLSAFRAS